MRSLVLFACCASTVGCLPDRDNPSDPHNRPFAVLEAQAEGEPPGIIPWTAEVELRSGESEPRSHDLTVQWFQRPEGEADWEPIHEARVPTAEPVLTRFSDFVPVDALVMDTSSGAQSATWSLRADVRDPVTGGFVSRELSVVVVNRAPGLMVPVVHEVAPGGRWWAGGAPIVTTVDAEPFDLDGDDTLQVTWALVSGSGFSLAASGDDVDVTMPAGETRGVLEATVTDRAGLVSTARVQLAVRDVLWHTEADGAMVRTGDSGRQFFAPEPFWMVATGGDGTGQVVWGIRPSDVDEPNEIWRYDVGSTGSGVQVGSVGAIDSPLTLAGGTRAADGGLWVAFRDPDSSAAELLRLDAAGAEILSRTDLPVLVVGLVGVPPALQAAKTSSNEYFFPHSVDADPPTSGLWLLLGDELDPSAVLLDAGGLEVFAPVQIPLGPGQRAHGIHADGTGGAWMVLADELDFGVVPTLIHVSAAGVIDRSFDAPAAAATALTLAVDPVTGRVVIEAVQPDGLVTLWRFDPPEYQAVELATHTALASDLVFDPVDGGLWTVRPDIGAVRKTAADGTLLGGTSALTPVAPPNAGLTIDAAGRAWIVDRSANILHGIGGDVTESTRSHALQLPREIRYDPVRNRVLGISVPEGIALELGADGAALRTWNLFAPPFGFVEGAASIDVDPDSGDVWIAGRATQSTASRLWRVESGGTIDEIALPSDVRAVWGIEVDPATGEVCLAGSTHQPNTPGSTDAALARIVRLSPAGGVVRSASVGSVNSAERVRARGADCFFLSHRSGQGYGAPTQEVGRMFDDESVCTLALATVTAQRIAASATTDDIYWTQRTSTKVRRASLDAGCTPVEDIDIEFLGRIWTNPTDIAVDPVSGSIFVAAGPDTDNPSASAILRFSPTGADDRSPDRVHEALEPQRLTVNR